MEELRFVPSAFSEPRWALHMCDDKCGEEGFTFFTAAAVVSEGGAADTLNLCKKCVTTKGDWSKAKKRWRCHFERELAGCCRRSISLQELHRGVDIMRRASKHPSWRSPTLGAKQRCPGPDSRCTRLETPSTEEEVNCAAGTLKWQIQLLKNPRR